MYFIFYSNFKNNSEERIIRQSIHEYFQRLEKPFLEDQRFYEREFSNLIQKIREPPSILARARFLMGSPMQGGGNVIMCEVRFYFYFIFLY